MKNVLFFLFGLFPFSPLVAQNGTYAYDNAGNRISRTVRLPSPAKSLENSAEESMMEDFIAKHSVRIYPNPTRGTLTVEILNLAKEEKADFLLTDLSGKALHHLQTVSGRESLDLSNHPAGIYVLRITIHSETMFWKIIKE